MVEEVEFKLITIGQHTDRIGNTYEALSYRFVKDDGTYFPPIQDEYLKILDVEYTA